MIVEIGIVTRSRLCQHVCGDGRVTVRTGMPFTLNGGMGTDRSPKALIPTIIDTDPTPTWTTCETHSSDLKRMSSTDWEGANASRTSQDLVIVTRASAHRARSRDQNLMSQRAVSPTSRTRTSERLTQQMRTNRTGSLPRHPRPNWSSGR